MSDVGELLDRKERPAYVRFERVAVEDVAASATAGHYVARDVDFALITPPYSKDVFKIKVEQWKQNMKQDVQNGRLPQQWMDMYLKALEAWKNGQELPLHGTPIKGWGVISPAQQETLIRMTILTVEDLAGINDEGMRRIGMGGLDMKNKANAWLKQLNDKGPLTQEMAAVKRENETLKSSVATLARQVEELTALVKMTQSADHIAPAQPQQTEIAASDIIDEPVIKKSIEAQYEEKFGKKPHHKMLRSTIEAALRE